MRFFLLAGLTLSLGVAPIAQSIDAESEVRAHIEALFNAMHQSDADAVRNHFHGSTATLYSVSEDDSGMAVVREEDINRFAVAVGDAQKGLLDERLGQIEVRIDGALATAFMPYAFYVGDRFSHCGVNSFHLVRTESGWRTIHITDTRRTTGCDPSIAPSAY